MTDSELADVIIERLNKLIENHSVRRDIERLIETRLSCHPDTQCHPTIQIVDGGLGFLGLLNGIVGVIPEGRRKNWGYITAVFTDNGTLEKFTRTEE